MALHPEVVKKAQAEIDAVVGNDRLPTFADREHLPYTNAVAKEVLRWHSVVPTGECPSSRKPIDLTFDYRSHCPSGNRS
jgi:cytochrome P450